MLAIKLGLIVASFSLCLAGKIEGKNVLTLESRVVNGDPAGPNEFPFLASLQFLGSHYCGCTILSSEWLLTAAHCIYGNSLSDYKVRVGTNNWPSGGSLHSVVEGEYHSEYVNSAYWPNDVAVIKVSPPIAFGSNGVEATVLADANSDVNNETPSVVAGWGALSYGGPVVDDMLKANVLTYSDAECLAQYGGSGPEETMICAGGGGTGICGGDSGGPLLVNGVQVGITSWTRIPCADIAAVWTQVSYYRDWIKDRTGV